MRVQTFTYTASTGFSVAELPASDSDQVLVLAFGAPELADTAGPFDKLTRAFPKAVVLGCSTAGEIAGTKLCDESLTVAVVTFEHTMVRSACADVSVAGESLAAGASIARQLGGPDLRSVFVLSDGLCVNGTALVDGLNRSLPAGVSVSGGLAGDGTRFQRTWVLRNGRPAQGIVAAVGFYGRRFRCGHGSRGGWDVFGPQRVITKAAGNVLYELDGTPALELYKKYLGERAAALPASASLFPLALRFGSHPAMAQLVRTVLSVDEATQSMTFAGDMVEGASAQLMRANSDRLIDGASIAARLTQFGHASGPVLAIAVSCVGRRLVLGERTEEEIEATLEAFPAGTRQIGFYSYGEISPHAGGHCDLHNQTMTLTAFGEM